jgi:uncharacterized protein
MNKIRQDLVDHIKNNVFPLYAKNDKGHQLDHIEFVITRSLELSKNLEVDNNMVYTIAAYHDCGHHIDKDKHEIISADIMFHDDNLRKFFSAKQIKIIKEAIEDHRASLDREPRSIYGKIVSSADRSIDVDAPFRRSYLYSLKHCPDYTAEQHVERVYNHIKEKFGPNGYAKMYLKDKAYENYLREIAALLADKEQFIERFNKVNGTK